MESSNLYELQQQQLATYSSLAAAQSTAIHQWNPSLPLNNDDYEHYMNEILPISAEILRKKKDINIGCDDEFDNPCILENENAVLQYLNYQNIWLTTSPAEAATSSSCNLNYVLDSVITSSNSNSNANLAADFTTYFSNHDSSSYSESSSSSNKTKRVWSTSSRNEAAAKKQRAHSHQSSCSLPKTDAASVLTEAIGYIQFLHHQIQTLSTPCIKPSQSNPLCCFQGVVSKEGDLTSRGLSLVPTSVASYISSSTVGLHSSCIDDDKFYYN
ncbi:hypothetical protein C2S51_036033 [Perilla frutescens var. frutescens]|nr:hypothetical protein C2S51_036033 [Perilla frutescens var. frutescens]